MKAIISTRYGPPEFLASVDMLKPMPKPDEVLVRIYASTVSTADWRMHSMAMPYGFHFLARLAFGLKKLRKPILGCELSGEVESIGLAVTSFKVGDHVVAYTGFDLGCHAQYKCIKASGAIVIKPRNLSFEQASALCFGGVTMLDFYRRAKLKQGERVLINGASGTVGGAAVQLAKHFGAHVTAVCSDSNADIVRSLGADRIIDYTKSDFSNTNERYDVIVDTVGNAPYARSARVLAKNGRLLLILADLPSILRAAWQNLLSSRRVLVAPAAEHVEYVAELCELAAAGKFTPHIDSVYCFHDAVDAHRRVDSGRKRGSVVLLVESSEKVSSERKKL
jgi:NADPH:quinone reductase-like Zn-dependent oxidoreductase